MQDGFKVVFPDGKEYQLKEGFFWGMLDSQESLSGGHCGTAAFYRGMLETFDAYLIACKTQGEIVPIEVIIINPKYKGG